MLEDENKKLKSDMRRLNNKTKVFDNENKWEKIWDEIYLFQDTLPNEIKNKHKVEDMEALAEKYGLFITRGRKGEPLYINGELDKKIFLFRIAH